MTHAFLRRFLLLLLAVVLVEVGMAKSESGSTPVPYTREARFSKRYDPNLVPDKPAYPGVVAPLEYPKSMKAWGQPAYAVVAFLVKETGTPVEVQCIEATDRAFAKAAERMVERSLFIPALKHQQGVTSKIVHRFEFYPNGTPPKAEGDAEKPAATESQN